MYSSLWARRPPDCGPTASSSLLTKRTPTNRPVTVWAAQANASLACFCRYPFCNAEAARIYAEGFGQAPEFFNFVRTLDLYRETLDERTTLFLSRDDEIMDLMKGDNWDDSIQPGSKSPKTQSSTDKP